MQDPVRDIEARIRERRTGNPYLPTAVVPSHRPGTWLADSRKQIGTQACHV
jgi:hypothetical protein